MTMEMTEEQWSRWVIAHVFAAVHNKSLSSPSLSIRYFDFGFEFIWKSDFGDSELPLFVIVLVGLPPSLSLGWGTKKKSLFELLIKLSWICQKTWTYLGVLGIGNVAHIYTKLSRRLKSRIARPSRNLESALYHIALFCPTCGSFHV